MSTLFPYANILAGTLVLIVGFGFHFCGQLISVVNYDYACRLGLQEKDLPPDYFPYEYGTAMADVLLGWTYGLAALGLYLGASWGYGLAFLPGSVLLYHSLNAWFWEAARRRDGKGLWTNRFRNIWCGANFLTGLLTLAVAWSGTAA
ncbi:MAG: hypothetical protein QNJ44_02480 [Rhodobacter sp.]|nr:hypothetical protein [Rhodobacter sp.]